MSFSVRLWCIHTSRVKLRIPGSLPSLMCIRVFFELYVVFQGVVDDSKVCKHAGLGEDWDRQVINVHPLQRTENGSAGGCEPIWWLWNWLQWFWVSGEVRRGWPCQRLCWNWGGQHQLLCLHLVSRRYYILVQLVGFRSFCVYRIRVGIRIVSAIWLATMCSMTVHITHFRMIGPLFEGRYFVALFVEGGDMYLSPNIWYFWFMKWVLEQGCKWCS